MKKFSFIIVMLLLLAVAFSAFAVDGVDDGDIDVEDNSVKVTFVLGETCVQFKGEGIPTWEPDEYYIDKGSVLEELPTGPIFPNAYVEKWNTPAGTEFEAGVTEVDADTVLTAVCASSTNVTVQFDTSKCYEAVAASDEEAADTYSEFSCPLTLLESLDPISLPVKAAGSEEPITYNRELPDPVDYAADVIDDDDDGTDDDTDADPSNTTPSLNGKAADSEADPVDYDFSYIWISEPDATGKPQTELFSGAFEMPAEDTTVYPVFAKVEYVPMVFFDAGMIIYDESDASFKVYEVSDEEITEEDITDFPDPASYEITGKIEKPDPDPSMDDFEFVEWVVICEEEDDPAVCKYVEAYEPDEDEEDADAEVYYYKPYTFTDEAPTEDVFLYAVWKLANNVFFTLDTEVIDADAKLVDSYGDLPEDDIVWAGSDVLQITDDMRTADGKVNVSKPDSQPYLEGYDFLGWFIECDENDEYDYVDEGWEEENEEGEIIVYLPVYYRQYDFTEALLPYEDGNVYIHGIWQEREGRDDDNDRDIFYRLDDDDFWGDLMNVPALPSTGFPTNEE